MCRVAEIEEIGMLKKGLRETSLHMLLDFLAADEKRQIVPLLRLLLTTNAVFTFAVLNRCGM